MSFVWVLGSVYMPACAAPPQVNKILNDPLHRFGIFVLRAEVPTLGKSLPMIDQVLCKQQITRKRFEYVLPGPGRAGISNYNRFGLFKSTQDIGHQPVNCPVATTYDIACAG